MQQKTPAGDVSACKVNTALHSAGLGSKELARDTMLRLMNVVQTYDLEHGCVVCEEQMCSYLSSHATRAAVRALRFEGGPRIPKLSVQALTLSIMKILGALGKPRKDSGYPDGVIKDQGCSLLCYFAPILKNLIFIIGLTCAWRTWSTPS